MKNKKKNTKKILVIKINDIIDYAFICHCRVLLFKVVGFFLTYGFFNGKRHSFNVLNQQKTQTVRIDYVHMLGPVENSLKCTGRVQV